jgi:hypothetical protein
MIGEETEAMVATEITSAPIRGRMGTGLRWADLVLLIAVSTALFVVWPTLLWKTTRDASHVSRFAVSYLAVIPLAASQLAFRWRRVPLRELSAAVLIVWSVKMLITVGLYDGFVTRGRTTYDPPAAPEQFVHVEEHGYTAIPDFTGRTVQGEVSIAGGALVRGAWIYAPAVRAGVAMPPAGRYISRTPPGRPWFSPDIKTDEPRTTCRWSRAATGGVFVSTNPAGFVFQRVWGRLRECSSCRSSTIRTSRECATTEHSRSSTCRPEGST